MSENKKNDYYKRTGRKKIKRLPKNCGKLGQTPRKSTGKN